MVKGLLFIGLSISLYSQEIRFNNMNEYVNEIVKNNPKAYIEYLNTKVKLNEVDKEKALYEPTFVSSVNTSSQKIQTTPEDNYYMVNEDYTSKSLSGKSSLLGILPSGGQWEVGIEAIKSKSNYLKNRAIPRQYGTYLSASFIQPLLKNHGRNITEIKANSAEIMAQISEVEYKKIITDLVGISIQAYWQLYGAKKVYQNWKNLVDITEKNLLTVKDLVKIGKLAQTEELMLENTLYLRIGEKLNAKDKITELENQILTLLNINKNQGLELLFSFNEKVADKDYYELEDMFKKAINNWDEYKKVEAKLKYSLLHKNYYENQLLPELNLKLGGDFRKLNSTLENSYSDFDDEHNTWNAGLELRVPIFGNEMAKKDFENSKLEVLKTKTELDYLAKTLKNSLSTKIQKVNNTRAQVSYYQKGLDIKRQLLKFENIKMIKGKVGVSDLLREEEKLIEYEIKMSEKIIDLKVSEVILDKTAGFILDKYSVSINQINHNN